MNIHKKNIDIAKKKSRIFLAKSLKLRANTYEKVNDFRHGGMSQERAGVGLKPWAS